MGAVVYFPFDDGQWSKKVPELDIGAESELQKQLLTAAAAVRVLDAVRCDFEAARLGMLSAERFLAVAGTRLEYISPAALRDSIDVLTELADNLEPDAAA